MSFSTNLQAIRHRLESYDRWECVHFVTAAPEDEREALRREGFYVAEISADALVSPAALFAALARALEFPAYFGRNWDAVDECLRDLEWLGANRVVLVVEGADSHGLTGPFAGLLQCWLSAAQEWSAEKTPFHLIAQISEEPFGPR